jgi:hypothetical protein
LSTSSREIRCGKFNLIKLSELEVRKQYHIKISNRVSSLENLNVSEDIDRAWGKKRYQNLS